MSFFCYQCEQTYHGTGCSSKKGMCGKPADVGALQDLLIQMLKCFALRKAMAPEGTFGKEINRFGLEALFATLTNVNFDGQRILGYCKEVRDWIAKVDPTIVGEKPCPTEKVDACKTYEDYVKLGEKFGVQSRIEKNGADAAGVQEMIVYAMKGISAYGYHAMTLGEEDQDIYDYIWDTLAKVDGITDLNELLGLALKAGEINVKTMALLDKGNTTTFGHPEITSVTVGHKKGKAILVSGHDFYLLRELLKQVEGKGINVYTHGEMLPGLAYPELKKFKELAGHYGTAWQNQRKEFKEFSGPILMTTNCIMPPQKDYKGRIFTCEMVGFPEVGHVKGTDFSEIIKVALDMDGFADDKVEKTITTGFARNTVLSVAGKVVELVKAGKIKKFFLIGGCDGSKKERTYFKDVAVKAPKDSVILTLGCGKFKFNYEDFGEIDGIPRLLDVGQCNDAYSAVVIANALADAFETDINSLPLSLVISWYEQKAVAILLSLLHLGVKCIRLGPSLPAFVTPNVLNVLVEKFEIMPIGEAEKDLEDMLK